MEYRLWNGSEWVFFVGVYGEEVEGHLTPNETGQVYRILDPSWNYPAGKYRVGSRRYNCWTEFSIEAYLTIGLDKDEYHTGSLINITVTNISNGTLRFSDLAFELEFHYWNNSEWEFFTGIFGATAIGYLAPNESGYVLDRLKGYGWTFPIGKWRVGNRRKNCWAEFSIIPE